MIYLLSIMIHGRVKRPPKQIYVFTTMEAKGEGWDPVKIA